MENQLKAPTQPVKVSEADQKRLNEFKNFLATNHADELREVFLRIYFDFSQLVTRDEGEHVYSNTSGDLYCLQCLIEIFD